MQRTQSRPLYKVTAHELLPCQPWACSDANASSMTKNPGRSYPILQLYSRIPASSRPMRVHRAGSLGSSAHKAEDLQSGKAASCRTQRQAAGMHKAQSTFRDERNESPTCSCLVLLCICLPGTSAKAQIIRPHPGTVVAAKQRYPQCRSLPKPKCPPRPCNTDPMQATVW